MTTTGTGMQSSQSPFRSTERPRSSEQSVTISRDFSIRLRSKSTLGPAQAALMIGPSTLLRVVSQIDRIPGLPIDS
jgi:hypothetical protein